MLVVPRLRNTAAEKGGEGLIIIPQPHGNNGGLGLGSGAAPGLWGTRAEVGKDDVSRRTLALSSIAYQSWGLLDNLSRLLQCKCPCLLEKQS